MSLRDKLKSVWDSVRDNLDTFRWTVLSSYPIGKFPWSAIRRIGQSRLLALTIVVPFLGSLLLFNQSVVDLLTLSPDVVRRWLHLPTDDPKTAAHTLTLSRLYFVYFGLTFLGIGSALFVLFCPIDIKNYASIIDYQRAEGALVSRPKMTLILPFVTVEYARWNGAQFFDGLSDRFWRRIATPSDFLTLYSAVIEDMYLQMPRVLDPPEVDPEEEPESLEDHPFLDHHGRPDAEKIASILLSGRRMDRGFVHELEDVGFSDRFKHDLMALNYMANDHTKPFFRTIIVAVYGLGFSLLLIPTIETFFRVLDSLARA
jgi:hypothetical protein